MFDGGFFHGQDWTGQNLSGYWLSEKLRGWRVVWTGAEYITRSGSVLPVPPFWLEGMPSTPLDGELWAGRNPHEGPIKSAVSRRDFSRLTFHPFDIPLEGMPIERAISELQQMKLPAHCKPVRYQRAQSTRYAIALMEDICASGGEGIMARKPRSRWYPWRMPELLKLKPTILAGVV